MKPYLKDRSEARSLLRSPVRPLHAHAFRGAFLLWLAFAGLILLPMSVAVSVPDGAPARPGAQEHSDSQLASQTTSSQAAATSPKYRNTSADVQYVGSETCKSCHELEYERYFQTPHGQAATLPSGRPELKDLPAAGTTVCPDKSGHCYKVLPGKDGYFMTQFDRAPDGTEQNVEVEKIAYALGKPLMATSYVIQRGDNLFEAPLTFFAVPGPEHVTGWALSPGYANDTRGFNRPLTPACLTCHVGRPLPLETGVNRYQARPFEELAIGCESCHGPGALHIKEREEHPPRQDGSSAQPVVDTSIVNPKYLNERLADDTCMGCHELGEARVLQRGKTFQDYRPGVPLLKTIGIFKSKLLLGWNVEEWSDEMATSKCYRSSNGALRCSTCHDAHFTPSALEAAEFYRSKCLTCHQSASCTLPLAERQHTEPADNCITCHMPKHSAPRLIKFGGRGTSHRITTFADEPLPPADTSRTAVDARTGLILVNADSINSQERLDPVVLLKAYKAIEARHSANDYASRVNALLQKMSSGKEDPLVFGALANAEAAKHTAEGDRLAIHDLREAIRLNSDTPTDYMLLSEFLVRAQDFDGAIAVLSSVLRRFPYIPAAYEHLAACYQSAGQPSKAAKTIQRGLELFPSDKNLLVLSRLIRRQSAVSSGKPK